MANQRMLDGAAAVITIVAAVVSWTHYYPATPMIARLGLPGPRANSGRRCGAMRRVYSWGTAPTREVVCERARSFAGVWSIGRVNMDALTRRVTHAMRTLTPSDSVAWAVARDSIQQEMAKAGGQPIPCYAPWGTYPPWIVSNEAWRFSSYSIRLTAYHWTPRWRGPSGPPTWFLQIDGFPADPLDCGPAGVPHLPPGARAAPLRWSDK